MRLKPLLYFTLLPSLLLADTTDFFEKKIRPVLAEKCYECHGASKQFGGLRLDSRERILRGGQRGPGAVEGKPEESWLIKAVRHDGLQMPVGGKLKPEEISDLTSWVGEGLPWPEEKAAQTKAAGDPGFYQKLMREHWAFQPVRKSAVPAGSAKSANPVDAFVRKKLREANLAPAAKADRSMLARRAAFVLTGLPPAEDPARRFLDDRAPGAWERYVDGLIASPHYGERWARHWMDLVRYAETYGYEWNYEIHGSWRYRDYLIRAFNGDVRYDQLVREHIAGDLLDKSQVRTHNGINESVTGTAFFRLGEMGHDDCIEFRELRTDVVDNQIDTLTKAFQGVTVSCARCHDHKIDPIPTEDYYALYGILNSSRPVTRTLNLQGPPVERQSRLAQLKADIRQELAALWMKDVSQIPSYLQAAISWRQDAPRGASGGGELDAHRVYHWMRLLAREKVEMEDPLYPLAKLAKAAAPAKAWAELTEQYRKENEERERHNSQFTPFGDFRKTVPGGWNVEGMGMAGGPSATGDFAVAGEGDRAVTNIYPSGLYSHLLSDRLNGVLRSPLLPKDKKYLSLQVVGGDLGALRTVVDHCVIGENHRRLESDSPAWISLPTQSDQKLPIYVEFTTRSDNPRFPERPGKFSDLKEESYERARSHFGVIRAVLHDQEGSPKASLAPVLSLLAGEAPPDAVELVGRRVAEQAQAAVTAWAEGRANDNEVAWLDWMLRNAVIINTRNLSAKLRALTDEYRAVEQTLEGPAVVSGMGDFDPGQDSPIFQNGQATRLGKPAPRHFLSLMPEALRRPATQGSGRLEVAEAIASPQNPLTARVMVNRVWHWVFGRGLVATTDNFGRYGEAPTDAELLDHLAARFVEDGWSVKKLVRLLLTSETFQQSSTAAEQARQKDPENFFWHHYPVRRLEAEAVRDSILAASGRLDRTLFGPSVEPYRAEAKEHRRLFAGPLDGKGRRSIYLKVTRMEGTRFLELFDFPIPMQTRGNRDVTNVPPQALAMLNDPFVLDQARVWAEQLAGRPDDAVDARLAAMFVRALGRPPTAAELPRWRLIVEQFAQQHGVTQGVLRSVPVWQDVAHTMFNLKEFLYFL